MHTKKDGHTVGLSAKVRESKAADDHEEQTDGHGSFGMGCYPFAHAVPEVVCSVVQFSVKVHPAAIFARRRPFCKNKKMFHKSISEKEVGGE